MRRSLRVPRCCRWKTEEEWVSRGQRRMTGQFRLVHGLARTTTPDVRYELQISAHSDDGGNPSFWNFCAGPRTPARACSCFVNASLARLFHIAAVVSREPTRAYLTIRSRCFPQSNVVRAYARRDVQLSVSRRACIVTQRTPALLLLARPGRRRPTRARAPAAERGFHV